MRLVSTSHTIVRRFVRPFHTRSLACAGLLVWMSLILAACGGIGALPPPPRPASTATPKPTPAILFQADWSHGLDGWHATSGWNVVNGALENVLGAERTLTIPYTPTTGTYAIEFDLQVVQIPSRGGYYILDVPEGAGGDGYQTGVTGLRVPGPRPSGDHQIIQTRISPLADQETALSVRSMTDYEPGDQVKTYRLVVDGKSLQLYVNGRFYVAGQSTRGPRLANGPLVLRVNGAQFRITGLRILTA